MSNGSGVNTGGHTGRKAGILLAVSSLPTGDGEGALGAKSREFVDFLASSGQGYWQILPIGPVGKTLSPYQSRSAFAGNPTFIDPAAIHKNPRRYSRKGAFYSKFLAENAAWVYDYALFEAIRSSRKGSPLSSWPDEIRNPSSKTLAKLRRDYETDIAEILYEQFCFFVQWNELKRYANLKKIDIIGDLPIYIYEDSAEFWLRRRMFDVDETGRPASLAGVPPDGFSKSGQIWDNPVYDWAKRKKEVFAFWRERLTQAARLYNGVRIDHFRGFADYFAIPVCRKEEEGATRPNRSPLPRGEWRPGPGKKFTDMVREDFPGLFVFAEDLGELSAEARALVADSGLPGMKVLQFAFTGNPDNPYLPHNIQKNSVCCTGTHDNDTLAGWLRSAPKKERDYAMAYLGLSQNADIHGAMLAQVLASRADTAIIPFQDWLGLGSEARLNKPSTVGGRNWKWRIPEGALTIGLASRILYMTKKLYNR